LAGAHADSFNINANTGAVTLIENPDFEAQSAYNFTVIATDAAGNSDQQDIQVNIENVDDSAPEITSGDTAGYIEENSGANQIIYSVVADDSNDISETPITYSLSGDSDSALSIDAITGDVTLLDNPDIETQAQYIFTVLATDGAGNVSQGQTVTLNINNIDEIAPEITSGAVANNVVENSAAGQHVYTVTATDSADISGGVSYSLADDSDGSFSIDAEGKVTFTASADYEQQGSYSFSVVATDAAGNSSQPHVVSMQVDNLDETGPTITSSDAANDINENSGANQVVYTATAEDTDFNGDEVIQFSLDASSDSVFSINAETGEVTLAVDPDFEVQDQYSFTVIATDGSGNQSQSQTVSLSINDVDDFALSGKVYHWATQSLMDDVSISMHYKEGGEHIKSVSSSATGDFHVNELAADEVVVTAHRELQSEDTGRLVTSLDALAALKMSVGLNPNALDSSGINQVGISAYQYFAADVNKTGKVTSADALEILKMAVRTPDALEREWMFIDESQDFWDETANDGQGALTIDRYAVNPGPEGSEMTIEEASEANFVGVLLGDVYSNWQAPDSHKMNYSHFVNLENAGKAPMYQFGMSPQEVPFEINSDVIAVSIDENSGASQVVY
ncbi:MAG: cadherin repeat domain-containing protein, partial [Pseudomonadales bacterium]|nr:cadherin repeat domain-containing protein [Pseudomonadales bacterium]